MQAVLYARYSTNLQSKASIEDQFRLLRQRAEREGWQIVAEQADRAITGTVRDRPGLNAALAAIEQGNATILLAEALDRISRDQEDIAAIHKRIRFADARIVTLSEGHIGSIHIGMGGAISAVFLEQLAEKTRRGQIGRVQAGRIPGGLSYGYDQVRQLGPNGEPERGLRTINPAQAAVICRIFADYAAGKSPMAIAKALNAEGTPAPRGGHWRANAIIGHRQRGNGILHNELYAGRIVYNRQNFRKDPATRKRLARTNAADERIVTEAPHLRIVPDDLWQAAQARLARYAAMPAHKARRPKRLLSGMLTCGACGGSYILVSPGRWGCSSHRQTGTCNNGTTIADAQAQKRLWHALQHQLLHPDTVAAYIDEWRLAEAELRRTTIARRAQSERRIAAILAEQERLVDAIASGMPIEALRPRAEALDAELGEMRARIAADPAPAPIAHPALAGNYARQIQQLHHIADADEEARSNARALLTSLIDKIEVTPRQDGHRGTDLTIHGQLAALIHPQTQKGPGNQSEANCMSTMVAGAGFGRCHKVLIAA